MAHKSQKQIGVLNATAMSLSNFKEMTKSIYRSLLKCRTSSRRYKNTEFRVVQDRPQPHYLSGGKEMQIKLFSGRVSEEILGPNVNKIIIC